MAEKINLTPEMEAALKKANLSDADIQKVMENKDVTKLGLEDLDNVSGGAKEAPDDFRVCGMTQREAATLLQAVVDQFGTDLAIDFANAAFFPSNHWEEFLRESEGSDAGWYAVLMIWGKIYEGGF